MDAASEADSTWGTSIAVTESKEVYGWGYSNYGALGKTGEFKSPIKVSNINTAVGAALGGTDSGQFTYILKEDGTVSSLGYNGYGQLGNGTADNKSQPIQVGGGSSNAMRITHGTVINTTTGIQSKEYENELITNVTIAEDEQLHILTDGISLNQSFSLLVGNTQLSQGDVEYTSFNTNIATVGETDGIVTPVKGTYGTL